MRSSLGSQNVVEAAQISRLDLNDGTLDGSSDDQKQKLESLDNSEDDEKTPSQASQYEYFVVTDGGPASNGSTTVE